MEIYPAFSPANWYFSLELSNFSHFHFFYVEYDLHYLTAEPKMFGGYGSALSSLFFFPILFHHLLYQNIIILFHFTVRSKHHKVITPLKFSHDYLA